MPGAISESPILNQREMEAHGSARFPSYVHCGELRVCHAEGHFWVLLLVPAYLCCPCGTPLWCLEFVRVLKVLCSDTNQAVWRMVRRPAKCPSEIWGARMSASVQDGYRNSKPWSSFFWCTQANLDSSFNSSLTWSLLVQLLASWYI